MMAGGGERKHLMNGGSRLGKGWEVEGEDEDYC